MAPNKAELRRINPLLWLGAMCAGLSGFVLAGIWSGSLDAGGRVWTNTDFSNYWIASRLVLEGQSIDLFSGQDTYFRHMQAAFGLDYPWHNWSYPPSFLLMIWPLGLMPHAPSMVLFLFLTVCLFLHSASLVQSRVGGFVPLVLSVFLICNGYLAQNGFLTAALMLYGLALRERSPLLAGIAFGLLTVKPQLGLLIPILLLYERRWTVVLSASATALVLVALSALLFGLDSWRGYIEHNLPYQGRVMTEFTGLFLVMMPSVFGYLRSLGFDAHASMLAHASFAAIAFAGFLLGLFRSRTVFERNLLLLLASFLISPYALIYDMGALSAVAAFALIRSGGLEALTKLQMVLLTLTGLLPVLHPFATMASSLPVAPAVLGLCLIALLVSRRLPQARPFEA